MELFSFLDLLPAAEHVWHSSDGKYVREYVDGKLELWINGRKVGTQYKPDNMVRIEFWCGKPVAILRDGSEELLFNVQPSGHLNP